MPPLPSHSRGGVKKEALVICALGHVTGTLNGIAPYCVRTVGWSARGVHECRAPVRRLIDTTLAHLWFHGSPSGDEATMAVVWWEHPAILASLLFGGASAATDLLADWGLCPYPGRDQPKGK